MACALVDATSEQFKQKILQQHQNRSVDRRCAPTEQTNMNSEFSEGPQSTQDWLGDFRNPLCSWNLVSLEPCLPGTLVSGTLAQPTAYIGTLGFRNRDALIYCHAVPPPVSDCSLTGPFWSWNLGFLANWFSGTLSVA